MWRHSYREFKRMRQRWKTESTSVQIIAFVTGFVASILMFLKGRVSASVKLESIFVAVYTKILWSNNGLQDSHPFQNPDVEIITTETTETMDDGSSCTTIKTVKKGAGLDTFHKETRKALDDSKRESWATRW